MVPRSFARSGCFARSLDVCALGSLAPFRLPWRSRPSRRGRSLHRPTISLGSPRLSAERSQKSKVRHAQLLQLDASFTSTRQTVRLRGDDTFVPKTPTHHPQGLPCGGSQHSAFTGRQDAPWRRTTEVARTLDESAVDAAPSTSARASHAIWTASRPQGLATAQGLFRSATPLKLQPLKFPVAPRRSGFPHTLRGTKNRFHG